MPDEDGAMIPEAESLPGEERCEVFVPLLDALQDKNRQIEDLRVRLARTEAAEREVRAHRDALLASTCWRATAPLRRVLDWVRGRPSSTIEGKARFATPARQPATKGLEQS